ncbi:MAG: transferrin-binding protein-like solute binding protein, partial [Alphaproteobacteria bacterium]|nr:transferrin-binding protein-like solute binding protein [Alphaproteobacteria bacterium]
MHNHILSIVTISIFSIMLSGCDILAGIANDVLGEEPPRGGIGTIYLDETNTGNSVSNAINTDSTDDEFRQETDIAKDASGNAYNSLTEATLDTDNLLDKKFILQGLVVQRAGVVEVTASGEFGWNTDSATENDIVRITSPAISLTFNDNGEISAVTAYFADNEYQAIDIDLDALSRTSLSGTIDVYKNILGNTKNTAEITVHRSDSFFGFNSNYMAYVGWNVVEETAGDDATTAYIVTGSMIAGIETDIIPTRNVYASLPDTTNEFITFTGKGHGIYGDRNGGYGTKFDIKADIDFSSNLIKIASSNTVRCDSETDIICDSEVDASELNFTTNLGAINYNGNNIGGVVGTESLLGFIDARFYGKVAREFGGTFILKGRGVEYYYGVFGTERKGIVLAPAFNNAIGTDTILLADQQSVNIAQDNDGVAYSSFARAIGDTDNANDKNFTLKALSVYKDDRHIYTRPPNREWTNADIKRIVSITNIDGSAASISYNADDNISEVTLYLMGKNYTTDGFTSSSATEFNANIKNGATTDKIRVSRDAFGFASNYMAFITWNLAKEAGLDSESTELIDSTYKVHGNMIVGLESKTIPTNSKVDFDGKGFGTYGNLTGNHATVFDIKATVDFSDRTIFINSSNTMKCDDNSADFTTCTQAAVDELNFSMAQINYAGNIISSDVTAGSLSGTLDARFYGLYARELGGTFSLSDANNYYYGGFGGERGVIAVPITFAGDILEETIATADRKKASIAVNNSNVSYKSITAALADTANINDKTFVFKALSVYKDDVTEYTRTAFRDWDTADSEREVTVTKLIGSAISLNFNGDGKISAVNAYLKGKNYTANGIFDASKFTTDINGGTDTDVTTAKITIDKSGNFFGFTADANYMAYVAWNVEKSNLSASGEVRTDSSYETFGEMIAGMETGGENIPRSGTTVKFKGKGSGTYGDVDADEVYLTRFNMEANVTFSIYSVGFRTTDTTICLSSGCDNTPTENDDINIQGTLNFLRGTNNISGNILTGSGALTGTADARFYGSAARELGGTFALADSNYYYYGVFGGERVDGINSNFIFDSNINDDMVTLPNQVQTIIDANNSYTSLATKTNDSVTLQALATYIRDTSTETRAPNRDWSTADSSRQASLNRAIGSAASISYNEDGNISAITAYLNGKTYIADNFTPSSALKLTTDITNGADTDATMAKISVDRSADFFAFGNGLNYVTYLSWNISKEANDDGSADTVQQGYNISGIMLTGIEATADSITDFADKVGSSTVVFRGGGRGIYGEQDDDDDFRTKFNVEIEVDFNNKNIDFKSTNTQECFTDSDGNEDCNRERDSLDLTASLSLALDNNSKFINELSGTITNVNDLAGTVDARFYGDDGLQEFGGAFALKDATSYYFGAFGAHRDYVAAVGTPIDFSLMVFDNNDAKTAERSIPDNPDVSGKLPYQSITHAIAHKNDSSNVTRGFRLYGMSVSNQSETNFHRVAGQVWQNAYREGNFEITRATNTVGLLSFDGKDYMVRFNAYLNGRTYLVDGSTSKSNKLEETGNITDSDGNNIGTLKVDRNDSIFNFKPNNLFSLTWNIRNPNQNLVNDSDKLFEQRITDDGFMVAGIHTLAENIYTSTYADKYVFTGGGRGIYGNKDSSDDIDFDVSAEIDFNNATLKVSFNNSACVTANCLDASTLNSLNFMTPTLSYKNGNNITTNAAGSITAGDLTGTINTQFYGVSGQELGGIFAMTHQDTRYYYGYFGAQRRVMDSPADHGAPIPVGENVIATPKDEDFTIANYRSINAARTGSNVKNLTWKALGVYRNDTGIYNREYRKGSGSAWHYESNNSEVLLDIDFARITGSSLSLSFNGSNNISGVTLHTNDGDNDIDYATSNSASAGTSIYFKSDIESGFPDGASDKNITVGRSNDFGFSSNYMVYASWYIGNNRSTSEHVFRDDDYKRYGSMVAGFETYESTLPNSGNRTFTGRGLGRYSDISVELVPRRYAIRFDAKAEVDFDTKNVKLTFSNSSCSSCSGFTPSTLNFTDQLLTYTAATNNVFGTTQTTGALSGNIATNGGLKGTADARFYGDGAWELGGVFALKTDDNKKYYHGYFGAKRDNVTSFDFNNTNVGSVAANPSVVVENIPNDTSATPEPYQSLRHALDDNSNPANKTFKLKGLAVYGNINFAYSGQLGSTNWSDTEGKVDFATITNSGLSLTFNNLNKISAATLHLDKTYNSDTSTTSTDKSFAADINSNDLPSDATSEITLGRETGFGFVSNYMVYASWKIETPKTKDSNTLFGSADDTYGYMLAGMEANGADITAFAATNSSATFRGKGRGQFKKGDLEYASTFNTTATVNFVNKTVGLAFSNLACGACAEATRRSLVLSTTTLSYDTSTKIFSGTGTTGTSDTATLARFSGTINARFYGNDSLWEFGGIFAFKRNDAFYHGYFGAHRENIVETVALTKPVNSIAIANQQSVAIAKDGMMVDYRTIQAALDDKINMSSKNFTLKGQSVYRDANASYDRAPGNLWIGNKGDISDRNLILAKVIGSALSVNFNAASGDVTSATLHLHDGTNPFTYTANSFNNSNLVATANITNLNNDYLGATTKNLIIDRSEELFGFVPEYMLHASWSVEKDLSTDDNVISDNKYDINGFTIAGMEVTGAIPNTGNLNFTGKGSGIYGDIDNEYKTIFDIGFVFDLAAPSNSSLNITNTACVVGCTLPTATLNLLNISTTGINHTVGMNGITGTLTAGTLIGTLDARFYGDDHIRELGGTFSLADSTHYYLGAFGAERDFTTLFTLAALTNDVIAIGDREIVSTREINKNSPVFDNDFSGFQAWNTSKPSYTSFEEVFTHDSSQAKYFVLNALSVSRNITATYNRLPHMAWHDGNVTQTVSLTNTSGANARLGYDEDEDIHNIGAILKSKIYRTDKSLAVADRTNGVTHTADITTGEPNTADSATITTDRSADFFGFMPRYMIHISWNIIEDTNDTNDFDIASAHLDNTRTETDGFMMTGFEVAGNDIPTNSGSTIFHGKGRGIYGSNAHTQSYKTLFDVKANVDFSTRKVTLTSSNTVCTGTNCASITAITLNTLNFTTPNTLDPTTLATLNLTASSLTYASNTNNISGTVTAGNLTGTANARFYGEGSDANELGGTFTMQDSNNTSYYYGAFGTHRIAHD